MSLTSKKDLPRLLKENSSNHFSTLEYLSKIFLFWFKTFNSQIPCFRAGENLGDGSFGIFYILRLNHKCRIMPNCRIISLKSVKY